MICTKCGENPRAKGRSRCRSCLNGELRAWRARNPDRVRAHLSTPAQQIARKRYLREHPEKQYLRTHPEKRAEYEARRRIRKRNNGQEPYTPQEIFERDSFICQLCGEPTDRQAGWNDPDQPTIDHVVALANGGPDTPENVQTAHRRCNSAKRPEGWRPFVGVMP